MVASVTAFIVEMVIAWTDMECLLNGNKLDFSNEQSQLDSW